MPSGATMQARPGSKPKAKKAFRADIQGLRAFAVIAVILDHVFKWPSGGFVGVDIFFVISGFLITGHLIREWETQGRIDPIQFYKKRVKRILPAAALVLVVTVGVSFILLNKTRSISVLWDGLWASFFAANWRFASVGTDYFQAEGPVSPLQHFWSLAVEEQFYFVWPWVMLAALVLTASSKAGAARPRIAAGALIAVICVASLVWAIYETTTTPTVAYFSTFSRTWELGLGALLALSGPLLAKINNSARPFLAWIGIAGMVSSVFVISTDSAFPAPAALVPVLATALVIAAGTGGRQRFLAPLTNPVSGYLGNISFSLYLWHFPILILSQAFFPDGGALYNSAVLVATFVFSIFAFHLVEDAVRKSTWLEQTGRKKRDAKSVFTTSYQATAVGFLACLALVAVTGVMLPTNNAGPALTTTVVSPANETIGEPVQITHGPETATLQEQIQTALNATSWPKTVPSLDAAIGSAQAKPEVKLCGMPGQFSLAACTFGNPAAEKTAVLLGNSAAMTFASPLSAALGEDWNLIVHAAFGCPFSSVFVPSSDTSVAADCKDRNARATDLVTEVQPETVFIMDSATTHKAEGADEPMTATEWSASVAGAVSSFRALTGNVVFISAPPRGGNLAECYTNVSSPKNCVSQPDQYWQDVRATDKAAATELDATYLDTLALFCANGNCPAFAGNVPMKSDGAHMTIEYGEKITPALRELLSEADAI